MKRKNKRSFLKTIFKTPSRKTQHTLAVTMISMLMVAGLFTMFFSVYHYMVQFHNLDLSYNMALITNDVNQALKERNISINELDYRLFTDSYDIGHHISYTASYILSANAYLSTILTAILGAFMFCMGLFWNLNIHDEYNRKLR